MSLRPPDPKVITPADLIPGDILLSSGPDTDPLDSLIKLIDQGDYSHTSLYVGVDNGDPMVVEATKGGIKYESINVDLDAQVLVDAYRYTSQTGNHFGDPGWPVQPVIDQAMSFVGSDYSYNELLLAAVALLAANKSSSNPDLNALIRWFENLVGMGLNDWIARTLGDNKPQMTCVQVATAAFWQAAATPANKYGLQIQIVRPLPPAAAAAKSAPAKPSASANTDWERMRARLESAVTKAVGQPAARTASKAADVPDPTIVIAGSSMWPAGFCTPRDLETSPSLTFIGTIPVHPKKPAPANAR